MAGTAATAAIAVFLGGLAVGVIAMVASAVRRGERPYPLTSEAAECTALRWKHASHPNQWACMIRWNHPRCRNYSVELVSRFCSGVSA
jgi:hypothetical protein